MTRLFKPRENMTLCRVVADAVKRAWLAESNSTSSCYRISRKEDESDSDLVTQNSRRDILVDEREMERALFFCIAVPFSDHFFQVKSSLLSWISEHFSLVNVQHEEFSGSDSLSSVAVLIRFTPHLLPDIEH